MTLSVERAKDNVTMEFMASFADAWNRHDADAVVVHMTEDCIYEASSGPEPWGARCIGREATRAAVAATFAAVPDMAFSEVRTYLYGERGFAEWRVTGTRADGRRLDAYGCDAFEFRDGLIAAKRSYIKNRTA